MSDRIKSVFIPSSEPHYLNQNPSFVEHIYFTYTYCKISSKIRPRDHISVLGPHGSVTMSVST